MDNEFLPKTKDELIDQLRRGAHIRYVPKHISGLEPESSIYADVRDLWYERRLMCGEEYVFVAELARQLTNAKIAVWRESRSTGIGTLTLRE